MIRATGLFINISTRFINSYLFLFDNIIYELKELKEFEELAHSYRLMLARNHWASICVIVYWQRISNF
jgi:hypothetical protein